MSEIWQSEHTLAEPRLKVTQGCTPTPPNQCPYQVSPSQPYGLKVKSRPHLQPLSNVPTKYQLPIAQTKF